MTQFRSGREVSVAGVGLHPFGRFRDKDLAALALPPVTDALNDAGVAWKDIPVAYFGHVYCSEPCRRFDRLARCWPTS